MAYKTVWLSGKNGRVAGVRADRIRTGDLWDPVFEVEIPTEIWVEQGMSYIAPVNLYGPQSQYEFFERGRADVALKQRQAAFRKHRNVKIIAAVSEMQTHSFEVPSGTLTYDYVRRLKIYMTALLDATTAPEFATDPDRIILPRTPTRFRGRQILQGNREEFDARLGVSGFIATLSDADREWMYPNGYLLAETPEHDSAAAATETETEEPTSNA